MSGGPHRSNFFSGLLAWTAVCLWIAYIAGWLIG